MVVLLFFLKVLGISDTHSSSDGQTGPANGLMFCMCSCYRNTYTVDQYIVTLKHANVGPFLLYACLRRNSKQK